MFAAFSDPNELVKWWGPEGFSTSSLEFQPRVGESYRIEMQPPEGDHFYLIGESREVDPPARLAYTFVEAPDPDDVETQVDLSFRDLGESTEVGLTQGPFRPRPAVRFTATVGRTASTSSSGSSPPGCSQTYDKTLQFTRLTRQLHTVCRRVLFLLLAVRNWRNRAAPGTRRDPRRQC